MSGLRRSKRERKQVHTFYDDAAAAVTAAEEGGEGENPLGSVRKKKRRVSKSPKLDPLNSDQDSLEKQEEENDDEMDVEDRDNDDPELENPDNDDGQQEEEDYTPRTAPKARRRSPTSITPKRSLPAKTRREATPKTRAPSRKFVKSSFTALATKFLDENETPENSLFAALLNSCNRKPEASSSLGVLPKQLTGKETHFTRSLIEIARQVYDHHHNDPNAAQVSLYNLLFRSVGATYEALFDPVEVDLENTSDEEMTEHVKGILRSMEDTPIEKVLLLPDGLEKNSKVSVVVREYHAIYREFWYLLGVTALSDKLSGDTAKWQRNKQNNEGDDDEDDNNEETQDSNPLQGFRFQIEMVREVLKRMIEFSCLGQDDLRAGTTLAVYQLAVAILERTVELRDKIRVAERQLSVAKKNRLKRKTQALESQTDAWNRMCTDLEELVTDTVMGIFMKRYKDIHPKIRAESIVALTSFVIIRPDIFFKNAYIKYFGWMLSDKAAVVREKAVAGLLAPFKANEENSTTKKGKPSSTNAARIDTSLMAGMAEKFASRLADCTMDVETTVQEQAMELLLVFSREGLLDSVEDESFWNQVNGRALAQDTSTSVRWGALQFVLEQLEAFDQTLIQSESDAVERINSLATWITHCVAANHVPFEKLPYDRVAFVITSLRLCPEHISLVENYPAMLRALKECGTNSSSQSKLRLEVVQRRVVLEMLVASVEQEMPSLDNLEGVIDPALLNARRPVEELLGASKKARKKDGLQEKLTVAMLEVLPELLATFRTETDLIRGLTTLPKFFLPNVLNTSSQRKHFSALLEQLSSLFLTATDYVVLFNCCLALTLLAKGDHTRSSEALVVLKRCTASVCDELTGLLERKAKTEDDDISIDVELSISLSLRRLSIVSKRWPLSTLLNGGLNAVEKLSSSISEVVARYLNERMLVRDEEDEESEELAPEIWESGSNELHEAVKDTIIASLSLFLSTTAWALQEQLDLSGEDREDSTLLLRMRDRVSRTASLCFEIFIEDNDTYTQHHRYFSRTIQAHAAQVAGDIRSLFPKEWAGSTDSLLRACAFTDDSNLIGGSVRFLLSQESKLRLPKENRAASQTLLLPFVRGLCSNWKAGNRREAGTVLAHITGSGAEATSIVSSLSRVLKKIDPVRLIEAHMAGLRQLFEDWAEGEPEEPQGENPSEEEIEEYEDAEKAHKAKFELIEQQAKRLSSSLGVGKLSEESLQRAMLGFVREGVRFAFSTNDPNGGAPLFLGARLPFLRILSKYLNWIRKDKDQVETLREDFNQKEAELRNHPDFVDVLAEDMKALSLFRQAGNLGTFLIEDDKDKSKVDRSPLGEGASSGGSDFRRRSLSHASSISSVVSKTSTQKSLSPLPEEEGRDGDDAGEVTGGDEHESHDSSLSSRARNAYKLKKHSPIEEASEESSDDS